MEKLKKKEGITLIALVVTIVVLMILAGISIAMLTGENGILKRASEASRKEETAQKDEKTILSNYEDYINEYTTGVIVEQVTDTNPGVLEGRGTEVDPYVINSIEDLVFFAYDVRNGNTYEGEIVTLGLSLDFNSSKSYVDPFRTDYEAYGYVGELKLEITQNKGFIPIGINQDNLFAGIFDGNGNTIANLYINVATSETSPIGFFATNSGTIKNIKLTNSNLISNANIWLGTIAGYNLCGNIENCYVSGDINSESSTKRIGGITGNNNSGTIESCYNFCKISASINNQDDIRIGGIVGFNNSGNISKSCNSSSIEVKAKEETDLKVGGIVGYQFNATIEECYNSGELLGETTSIHIGGILGSNEGGTINNSYNIGNIVSKSSTRSYLGGIFASAYKGQIKNCYNSGNICEINSTLSDYRIGGISGYSNKSVSINNCYNIGLINNNSSGGYIGGVIAYATNSTIKECYSIFETKNIDNKNNIGAITALNNGSIFENCYYSSNIQDNNGIELQEENMPTILAIVNGEEMFIEDTNFLTPILKWQ